MNTVFRSYAKRLRRLFDIFRMTEGGTRDLSMAVVEEDQPDETREGRFLSYRNGTEE